MITFKNHINNALQEHYSDIPTVTVDALFLTEEVFNTLPDKSGVIIEAKTYFNPIPG